MNKLLNKKYLIVSLFFISTLNANPQQVKVFYHTKSPQNNPTNAQPPAKRPSITSHKVITPAPQASKSANTYVVKKGDSLHSIALSFDVNMKSLARHNKIVAPYTIYPQQVISIPNKKTPDKKATTNKKSVKWLWPTTGKVISTFAPSKGNKGIDIKGKKGQKVFASASGTVVYAGNELKGYGNMLLIDHAPNYVTIYAHNDTLKVKEGSTVKRGQLIATMGNSDSEITKLHFEIREDGEPLNPLKILPQR